MCDFGDAELMTSDRAEPRRSSSSRPVGDESAAARRRASRASRRETLSSVYDERFFAEHVPWRGDYVAIADALDDVLEFSTVLDLGCGSGYLLARLRELGKAVRGVDGSRAALEAAPPELDGLIEVRDLRRPFAMGSFDLVMCTEVAEHLAARHAARLVGTICGHSRALVYFTAAAPGQTGHHHVNEQPQAYWIAKFARRGFGLDRKMTQVLTSELDERVRTVWWFARNSLVFRAEV